MKAIILEDKSDESQEVRLQAEGEDKVWIWILSLADHDNDKVVLVDRKELLNFLTTK